MSEIPNQSQNNNDNIEVQYVSSAGEHKTEYVDLNGMRDFPLDKPEFHVTEEEFKLHGVNRNKAFDHNHERRMAQYITQSQSLENTDDSL